MLVVKKTPLVLSADFFTFTCATENKLKLSSHEFLHAVDGYKVQKHWDAERCESSTWALWAPA